MSALVTRLKATADPSAALRSAQDDKPVRTTTKRVRPEDGGVVWHERMNAFECLACNEFFEVRNRLLRSPAGLAELREMLVIDHTECWEYNDARMARMQRRFRKEMKRQQNLAAQRVSWRGGR